MSVAVLEKPTCPKCGSGSGNQKKYGFTKDRRRKWKCGGCGRRWTQNPNLRRGKRKPPKAKEVYVPKPKKCVECGEELVRGYLGKTCEKCITKKAIFCSRCGKRLGDSNRSGICWSCKKELIQEEKRKRYVNLNVEYENDVPKCVDCGQLMERDRGKWSCMNEYCSVISLEGRKGMFKLTRDSITASQISGQVVMLEVS